MEPGASMPHSQGLSSNPYLEQNQTNSPHIHISPSGFSYKFLIKKLHFLFSIDGKVYSHGEMSNAYFTFVLRSLQKQFISYHTRNNTGEIVVETFSTDNLV